LDWRQTGAIPITSAAILHSGIHYKLPQHLHHSTSQLPDPSRVEEVVECCHPCQVGSLRQWVAQPLAILSSSFISISRHLVPVLPRGHPNQDRKRGILQLWASNTVIPTTRPLVNSYGKQKATYLFYVSFSQPTSYLKLLGQIISGPVDILASSSND
jgi:hypothetical protein